MSLNKSAHPRIHGVQGSESLGAATHVLLNACRHAGLGRTLYLRLRVHEGPLSPREHVHVCTRMNVDLSSLKSMWPWSVLSKWWKGGRVHGAHRTTNC
jgi:hypothetical protein